MKSVRTRALALALCFLLAAFSVLPAFAAEDYRNNPRFHNITASQSAEMLERGERFLLYCYRSTCGNCRAIGGSLLTKWMDTYEEDVHAVNIDTDGGIPSWAWLELGLQHVTLPVIVFVRNGTAQAFSGTQGLDALRAALAQAFPAFHESRVGLTILRLPDKLRYRTGEPADFHALTLRAVLPDGTVETIEDGYTADAPDTTVPGTKTVTVFYKGLQTQFTVHVDSADGTQRVWILPDETQSLDYGQSLTLRADTDNLPADGSLRWQYTTAGIFGKKTTDGSGDSFTIQASGFTQTVEVRVTMVDADGRIVTQNGTPVSDMRMLRLRCGLAQRLADLMPRIRAFFARMIGIF